MRGTQHNFGNKEQLLLYTTHYLAQRPAPV
jgi:hypothetical protein